ncbi:MAG: hypothetical protein ABI199_10350 [Bacteroidia bacterium]
MKNLRRFKSVLVLLFFTSCSHNRLDVDVSKITIPEVKVDRLDQEIFQLSPNNTALESQKLEKKYGIFYAHLISNFINDGGIKDTSYLTSLKRFITDPSMREAYDSCEKKFANVSFLQTGLTDAFKHFKYYFPEKKIPKKVVVLMSGFNYSVVNFDGVLGVCLEMYLGSNCRFYPMLQLPQYKTIDMSAPYMVSDCVKGWMNTEFPQNETKNNFLTNIIHAGKILYVTDAMLPDVSDTLKTDFSKKQTDWCIKNEYNMWAFFIQQKMLYSNDFTEIVKFTNEGPFTAAFNKESPARTGNWIGWRIVQAYMNNHPEVSLQQLMDEKDCEKILLGSKYKPSK